MAAINDTEYAYASARIRAIEKKLLDRSRIERMLDAKTPEEAIKILQDLEYGNANIEITGSHDYEVLLKEEQNKTYELLRQIAPEPRVLDIFLLRSDYHNIKVLLKAEFSGQAQQDEMLLDTALIPKAKLKIMIKERSFADMSKIMRGAIGECIDTYNRTGDPQVVDLIMDKAVYEEMTKLAKDLDIGFIKVLVETLVDINNIKTFVRIKKLNKSWDFLKRALLGSGSIDIKIFIDKLQTSWESFIEKMKYTKYGEMCEEGIAVFRDTGSITRLEKLADDFIISYVKDGKLKFFGVEPIIGYLIAKENELKIVRIIMIGKINNIANEIIRERLREAYV